MGSVTQLLQAAEAGDPRAAVDLLPLVYDELRRLAAARMAAERSDHVLDATALVHEAYLKLVATAPGSDGDGRQWRGRAHFFAAAAEAMRRILVDQARRRQAEKRGGQRVRVPLEAHHRVTTTDEGLIALDEALGRLAAVDARKADLVKLRFFAGMTMPEAAAVLDVSVPTAERWWTFARTWLFAELADESEKP